MAEGKRNAESSEGPSNAAFEAIVGNMVLAHEMIVNEDFKLEGLKENTFEKAVRDVVHTAFWDALEFQLSQTPPQYERAIMLLSEIKETLTSLMMHGNTALKEQVDEVLDVRLIKQEVDHGCFELGECAKFIIIIMGKLCAPQRDEQLNKLKDLTGIAPTLRGILEFLDLMKMDMANFQLEKVKPILMTQAIEYERGKFQEFLKNNPDGTRFTKNWLKLAIFDVKQLITNSKQQNSETHKNDVKPMPKIAPGLVLTHAYLKLLDWQDGFVFPETLLMDELRLAEMSHMLSRLCLIGSLMLTTSNTIGQLSDDSTFIKKLKDHLFILIDSVPNSKLSTVLPNLFDQIAKETKETCKERGIPYLDEEKESNLKKQIENLFKGENNVYSLIKSRIRDYVLLCMTSERTPKQNEAPLALATIQDELKILAGRFSRLITHNRKVHVPVYNKIINELLADMQEEGKENEATAHASATATENAN